MTKTQINAEIKKAKWILKTSNELIKLLSDKKTKQFFDRSFVTDSINQFRVFNKAIPKYLKTLETEKKNESKTSTTQGTRRRRNYTQRTEVASRVERAA